MIDLSPWVGKMVFIQLVGGTQWLAPTIEKSVGLVPLLLSGDGKSHVPLMTPFLRGELHAAGTGFKLVIPDPGDEVRGTRTNNKIEVGINPAIVATISAAIESRIALP